jgi:dienelactone hydrolase
MMRCRSRAGHRCRRALAVIVALLATGAASAAALSESAVQVPITMDTAAHGRVARPVTVFIVRDQAIRRAPYLVLLHGRPPDAAGRIALGLQTYPANARYFAEHGFVVLIPTRIGYGVTGGPDLEYTGPCEAKEFRAGIAAALEETKAVIAFAAALPYVDTQRGLVVGESFGGLVAVASAADALPGLRGAVNVSGGDGGDSLNHVDQPCQPDRLADLLREWGAHTRLPTLWLYSANDRFWGPTVPTTWFRAFRAAGGQGEFVSLPADKNNGHFIFTRNAPAWHPAFESFVTRLGFAAPAASPSGGATVSTP